MIAQETQEEQARTCLIEVEANCGFEGAGERSVLRGETVQNGESTVCPRIRRKWGSALGLCWAINLNQYLRGRRVALACVRAVPESNRTNNLALDYLHRGSVMCLSIEYLPIFRSFREILRLPVAAPRRGARLVTTCFFADRRKRQ